MMKLEVPPCDELTRRYFDEILKKTEAVYDIAKLAKSKGYDLTSEVETKPASNLADRTEKIIGPPGVAIRYFEIFERTRDRTKTIFEIFKEIIEGKLGKLKNDEDRLEQAIKTSLVLITEGVVVAPIDGLPHIKISENQDKTKYVDLYFASPIRAAGGTAAIFPLILGHYGAVLLGLDKYKPLETEIERYVEENKIYHKLVSRQYKMNDEDIKYIIRNCPVCINGEGTEDEEVSINRNLPRVPTNKVRGGTLLIINEGFGLKSAKLLQFAKSLNLDWSWLDKFLKVKTSGGGIREVTPIKTYLEGAAAGRPIFAYPSTFGAFRLRYGRTRTTGLMGKAIHPATMYLLEEFPAMGSQFKVERPGKATTMTSCSTIEGPVILTEKGIQYIKSKDEIPEGIKKILFLGDMLVSIGDFRKTGHPLVPVGFCEEWWKQIINSKDDEKSKEYAKIDVVNIEPHTAVKISEEMGIPLHPKYLFYYKQLNRDAIVYIKEKLTSAQKIFDKEKIIILQLEEEPLLETYFAKALIPYTKKNNQITIENIAYPLLKTFGVLSDTKIPEGEEDPLKLLSYLAGFEIKDKGGTFIGARLGRPEAAKPRKMDGSPQSLFPIGKLGGATRNVTRAANIKAQESKGLLGNSKLTNISIRLFKCPKCKTEGPYVWCFDCNTKTIPQVFCQSCNRKYTEEEYKDKEKVCRACKGKINYYVTGDFDFSKIYIDALKRLEIREMPEMVKGVEGLISEVKEAEPVEKGILRAKNKVYVFKDGTIRMDLMDASLSHFKPYELGLTVEQMYSLGYTHDMNNNKLTDINQTVFLYPQDVIVNTSIGNYLVNVAGFVDDLLEKFYKLPRFYNVKTKEEMVGHLILGLAPHTSAGIVGRIIGYSDARVLFAHPYHNCARRRNCLTKDTQVVLNDGKEIYLTNIGSLDDGSKKEEIKLNNTYTYAINEYGRIHKRKVIALFKQKTKDKLLKLKTKFGRQIKVTPKQKILYEEDNKVKYKNAKDLKVGDNLLSLNKIVVAHSKEINVFNWYVKNSKFMNKLRVHNCKTELIKCIKKIGGYTKVANKLKINAKQLHTAISFDAIPLDIYLKLKKALTLKIDSKLEISYNKQKSRIPAIIKLTKEFGQLVGYYLADGYARTSYGKGKDKNKYVYQVNFVSAEKEITHKLEKLTAKIFNRKLTSSKNGSVENLSLSGRVYYDFFIDLLKTGKGAKNKRVPQKIINSNSDCIRGCIAGYVVGDGHIEKATIKTTSINKELINDFSFLLATQNLFAHVFEEKEREIKTGLVKEYYEKKGKIIKVKSYGFRLYSADFKVMVPYLFGVKLNYAEKNLRKIKIRKKLVKRIGNFIVDKLIEIKEIEYREKYVYDLIVEKEKTFIGGFGNLGIYDCDGDQDSIMLFLDALLNFSTRYLPKSRGGKMDAPLVATILLNPSEIDDEAHEIELVSEYPLTLYEAGEKIADPYLKEIAIVKSTLGTNTQFNALGFTHDTKQFDEGPKQSRYTKLTNMAEKIVLQIELQDKIEAVDKKGALEMVINTHLFPDLIGNTRAYSRQQFRCGKCNKKFRRLPLYSDLKCPVCKSGNIILTISEGSVIKYLEIAKNIVYKRDLSKYTQQRMEILEKEISSVFTHAKEKQKSIGDFF